MWHILYLSSKLPDETQFSFIYNFKKGQNTFCFSEHPLISSKDELIASDAKTSFPFFKKTNLPAKVLEKINPDDTVITLDWESFQKVQQEKRLKINHQHIATDLPEQRILKNLIKRPPELFVVSKFLQENLSAAGLAASLSTVTYPPLLQSENIDRNNEHKSFIVGAVNKLEKNQGLETLIQSFHQNQEFLPQLRIIIVGDGSEKRQLLWLIDQLHLRKSIQIVSQQKDYYRFINNFDVFVAPQIEPQIWNHSIAEALNLGVPVIASSSGSHPEVIEHGKTGLIFEPGNSSVLGQHLINLYNHQEWMGHYQKSGPTWIRQNLKLC